jgi:hypothetical protein
MTLCPTIILTAFLFENHNRSRPSLPDNLGSDSSVFDPRTTDEKVGIGFLNQADLG